ncbi:hypothetical protein [Nocardia brasiliensis]|uniref:hypothetical protein n=1 Tax=Nocardia brasiliensis TaxID=37326 RepID=UPI003672203B
MAVDAINAKMIGLRVSLLAALIVTGDLLLANEIPRDLALLAGQLAIELLLSEADTATTDGTRVHVAPLGTTCGPVAGTCSSRLRPGTRVTLTAEPSEYTEGALTWMGCPTGSDARYPCMFVMTSNMTICLFEAPYDGGPPLAWCRGER